MIQIQIINRIKEHGKTVAYTISDGRNRKVESAHNMSNYAVTNAIRLQNGEYKAKRGFEIPTKNKKDSANIQNRRTGVLGKPPLIYNTSYGDLTKLQKQMLKEFETQDILELTGIKVDMTDLSCMTAVTGVEYALFTRSNKCIVVKGGCYGMTLSKQLTNRLIREKFTWTGHTHPGNTTNCLMPSGSDYNTLRLFRQRRSAIFNSVGDYYIMEEGE